MKTLAKKLYYKLKFYFHRTIADYLLEKSKNKETNVFKKKRTMAYLSYHALETAFADVQLALLGKRRGKKK